MKFKLWGYYLRKGTNNHPESKVRCVGSYENAYVFQFENKQVLFVNKESPGEMGLYSNLPKPISLENK